MSHIKTVQSILPNSSASYQYVDDGNPKRGGVKDVYFSPEKKYVSCHLQRQARL